MESIGDGPGRFPGPFDSPDQAVSIGLDLRHKGKGVSGRFNIKFDNSSQKQQLFFTNFK
jgi:hypothetical protein